MWGISRRSKEQVPRKDAGVLLLICVERDVTVGIGCGTGHCMLAATRLVYKEKSFQPVKA